MRLADQYKHDKAMQVRSQSVTGVFVEMIGGLARVNVQGAAVDLKCDGWTPPVPGMPVRVDSTNGVMRVTGPAKANPSRATVLEVRDGGTRALIDADGEQWLLPVMAPYMPVVTDVVVVNWPSGHILGEEAASPDANTPDPESGGGSPSNPLIQATDSGKWHTSQNLWWGDSDVWTGVNNRGAWFYGGTFRALAGMTITSADIYMPLVKSQNNLQLALHPHPTRPGGAPTFTHHEFIDHRSGWVPLPSGWGVLLRDNPDWGVGVVSPGNGNNIWAGRARDNMSGAVRFTGRR